MGEESLKVVRNMDNSYAKKRERLVSYLEVLLNVFLLNLASFLIAAAECTNERAFFYSTEVI